MIPTKERQIEELKARVKGLEAEVRDVRTESLMEGYNQALNAMRNVAHGVIDVTWAAGPVAGLELLLHRLKEKDVIVTSPLGVPHDWLSRWKVELA